MLIGLVGCEATDCLAVDCLVGCADLCSNFCYLLLLLLLQAMWRELDALDAQVSAERAARAKLQGEKVASH
jgi:hypothetical protein